MKHEMLQPPRKNLTSNMRRLLRAGMELLSDATNYPVVDPGYHQDLADYRQFHARELVDPNGATYRPRKIPL